MKVDHEQYPVLYVDDERENLLTFRYALGDRFSIVTAGSGEEAVGILQEQDVAVLLCDQRMPGMTGVEVCRRAREICPDTVRIIVTAHADLDAAVNAINLGQVARYLAKPWRNEELIEVLHSSIEVVRLQRTIKEMQARMLRGGEPRLIEALNKQVAGALEGPVGRLDINSEQVRDLLEAGLSSWDSPPRARELVEHARQAHQEAGPAVADLREVIAKLQRVQRLDAPPEAQQCDAARVIHATVQVLRSMIGATVPLEVIIEHSPIISMGPAALGQVLANLVTNASQALEGRPENERLVTIVLGASANRATLRVVDRGGGIPAENVERVFDPHFSTRAGARGTGLAIVKHLVREAGGEVHVTSDGSVGSQFEVSLPRAGHPL